MIQLINGAVAIDNKLVAKNILIDRDKIVAIDNQVYAENNIIIDVKGCYITTGAVDVHTHLREPGYTNKETVATGTFSAAKGGVTAVMAMPNTAPTIDSLPNLQLLERIIAKSAKVRVFPFVAVTTGLQGQSLTDIDELSQYAKGFSDDGKPINDVELLQDAMKKVAKNNSIIASHLEADGYQLAPASEIVACERELALAAASGVKYHLCHLSTQRSFDLLKTARRQGANVSAEVTPHHLFLSEGDIENANYKMNPPLRSERDRQATVDALLSGVVDIIATDHAPHTEAEKLQDYGAAPNGIIGLETLFPLVYTHLVKSGLATLQDMQNWLTVNPAKRFGIPYGDIKVGGLADLAALDIAHEREYSKEEIVSKGKNSPFIGKRLYGFNALTMVGGRIIYNNLTEVKDE